MRKTIHDLIKKTFLITFVVMGLYGCEKEDDGINDPVKEPKLLLENTGAIEVPSSGESYTVGVQSDLSWQVETDSEWIILSETNGEKGNSEISFTVTENDGEERIGIINIWATEDLRQKVQVIQEAAEKVVNDLFVKENGSGDGLSWDSPVTLSEALTMAVTGNTIHIAEGTYSPANAVTGGNSSDEGSKTFEISSNITLIGGYSANATEGAEPDHTKYPTILDGGETSYHVVTVTAPKEEGVKTVLKGLTITNGNAAEERTSVVINGIEYKMFYGGGMIIGNAVVDIIDTDIVNNVSRKSIGGLYAFGGSVVTMKRCKVSDNKSGANGGGIWIDASKAYIYDSEVSYNEGGTAPGVHGYPDAEVYMFNSEIANNKGTSYGAAFYIRENTVGVMVNCVISGNSSTAKHGGGGVMMYNNNDMTIISSTITDNVIAGPGGGVYRRNGTNKLNIYNSIISGNEQKDDGPEVDVYEDDTIVPEIFSSIIGENVFNENGEEIVDLDFNISTMLEKQEETSIYVLVGKENPAMEYGMAAEELIALGSSLTPAVEEDIMAVDHLYNSRLNLEFMGAFVDGE